MNMLDRTRQRDLLNMLAEAYPNTCDSLLDPRDIESPDSVNLHYLEEHGLVVLIRKEMRTRRADNLVPSGARWKGPELTGEAKITAEGIDFLEDDGGLSAILGVVTVRLHSETIQEIETKILSSDQPEAEKARLLDRLRNMPEEGLKTLTQELVRTGLNQSTGMWETVLRALSG